jgi:NAD+--asparagine ADP-ribosyltransferase
MIRVEPGAVTSLGPRGGTQACVVLSGSGTVAGKRAGLHTSIKVEPGAIARVESDTGLELVVFGLPMFGIVGAANAHREMVNA